MPSTERFYDELAENHHWIFQDWQAAIEWQAGIFGPLLERMLPGRLEILDCACGIGTQSLGLAARGHRVTGSDLSPGAIARAKREAQGRGLDVPLFVADMMDLSLVPGDAFDAIICADNSLPHLLRDSELHRAAAQMNGKLKPGGVLVATMRDYDRIAADRPAMDPPRFFSDHGRRRIVHQVWDWIDNRLYVLHLYLTREVNDGWDSKHFVAVYRAYLRSEVSRILEEAGFRNVTWMEPQASGYYQPVVVAHKPSS